MENQVRVSRLLCYHPGSMKKTRKIRRRSALKGLGAFGSGSLLAASANAAGIQEYAQPPETGLSPEHRKQIFSRVFQTPLIDTHEHLIEEKGRFSGTSHPRVKSDDWTMLLSHYLNSDMLTAGMPQKDYDAFFSPDSDPARKWRNLAPYWPAVKNTGYGQAVCIAIRELYGVDELSEKTVEQVQSGYEKVRRPGFYRTILRDRARIESCQVNSLEGTPFMKSDMPELLMQDISIVGMFAGPGFDTFGPLTGITVSSLSDWHRVIDWWFSNYGSYAVAVKSQNAYSRDIDYEEVTAEKVEEVFERRLNRQPLDSLEKKSLEDHLFWYAVRKATEKNLPVKLHTGYYAGQNSMPLGRLLNNPGSASELCRKAPDTRFVFMHICYPYYEELISVAKQWTNAYIDMCWSWIINPVAATDFLKKYLVTAPANKLLTFGGDYVPVEPVLGHATIARRGIALALSQLVEEGWMNLDTALELIDPIMSGNARRIFNLEEKQKTLRKVQW